MRLAVFEPDIPQNLGAIMRLGACMKIPLDIIGPCGFPFSSNDLKTNRILKRTSLDYASLAEITYYSSWQKYITAPHHPDSRLLLLTTSGTTAYTTFAYNMNDTLLVGRESLGVPDNVHQRSDARLLIPMAPGARSLNVVVAAAMALGEACRQTMASPTTTNEVV